MRTRQRCTKVMAADQTLLEPIEKLKAQHPAWGYRRIWAYLRYRQNLKVGKNRIYRLLRVRHGEFVHRRIVRKTSTKH